MIARVVRAFTRPIRDRWSRISSLIIALAVAAGLLVPATGRAATLTWWATGSTGSVGGAGTWDTSGLNWTADGVTWSAWSNPTAPPDTAVFGGTAGTVTLSTGITVGGLTFDTTGYTISGNTLTLAGGTAAMTTNADSTTISSVITGTSVFRKLGSGTLTLSGTSNDYSGGTIVDAGVLRLGGSNNGESTVGSGTLTINSGATVVSTVNNVLGYNNSAKTPAVIINGGTWDAQTFDASFNTVTLNDGTLTRSGGFWYFGSANKITSTGSSTISGAPMHLRPQGGLTMPIQVDSGTLTISAVLRNDNNGASGFLKTGPGMLTLTAANTYIGTTSIDAGTLQIGAGSTSGRLAPTSVITGSSGATLAFNRSDTITQGTDFNDVIGGAINIAQLGSGALVLSNSNTFTGTATAAAGRIVTTGTGSLPGYASEGRVVFNGGRIDVAVGGSGWTTGDVDTLLANATKTAGTLGIDTTNGSLTQWTAFTTTTFGALGLAKLGSGTLTLDAANTYTGTTTITAGTLQVGSGGTTGSISDSSNVTVSAGGILAFNRSDALTFGGPISGGGSLNKLGGGVLSLSGSNTYSGGTTISAGTLSVAALADSGSSNLGTSGALSFSGGALRFTGESGTTSRAISFGTGGGTFDIATGGTMALSGLWTGSGGVTKSGAGTLTVSRNDGGTRVNISSQSGGDFTMTSGTLNITGLWVFAKNSGETASFLQTGGNVVAGETYLGDNPSTTPFGVTYTLTGGTMTTNTFRVGQNGASRALFTVGGGTTAAVATAPTFLIAASSTLSSGTLVVNSNGVVVTGSVSAGTGAATAIFDGGTLRLTRNNDALLSGVTTRLGSGGLTLDTNGFAVTTGQAMTNDTAATGQLIKTGAGVLTLSAPQSFTGAARIDAGTLAIGGSNTLASANRIFVAAGAALDATAAGLAVAGGQTLGGYGTVNGNVTIAGGAIVSPGGSIGTLTNTGTETWGAGGRYLFEITNAKGSVPGTDWDLLNVTALSITATSGIGNQFVIDLQSLTNGTDQLAGPMSGLNWDPTMNYQWRFLAASATTFSDANFDSGWFTVDSGNFLNAFDGSFSVARGGAGGLGGTTTASELYIVYVAVPEPGTLALAGLGLVVIALATYRRRRSPGYASGVAT
jgi:fibronectin-binding autotransporter adhesin